MVSFVKLGVNAGAWANKDKALEYLAAGYQVFADETCEPELTQEDLEAIDETIRYTGEIEPDAQVTISPSTASDTE